MPDGKIRPDGTAYLEATALTGDPEYNIARGPKSRHYTCRVTARFEGSRGTGSRVEGRICTFELVKR